MRMVESGLQMRGPNRWISSLSSMAKGIGVHFEVIDAVNANIDTL